jgi:serine/threonine-protein kinase
MATVYLARREGVGGFQRLFAIKRLHPHLARDGEFIQMFLDEARLAARIHHPNVVPIHEIGTSERGHYLVMDLIEGDTAARLFARAASLGHKLPHNVGLRIALDTLAGLHAAHELRDHDGKPLEIVHRDVSPQNILVGVDGIARITDFGVAKAATRLSVTKTGQLKGKLAYMAPEQARSKQAIDRRADVFAMGIVLWETLAFRRLFKGDSEADTLNRVLYEPIPTLLSAAPTIPASLDAIVMKALERDPAKRFATAAEMADALEKAAIALNALGTARDVAASVQEMLGADVEQQREVVRAWLARSEPSRNEPRRAGAESVTRVERPGGSMTPPPGVTSVSSSVMQLPPPSSSNTMRPSLVDPPLPPPKRRSRGWGVALGAASVLVAWGLVELRGHPRPPAPRAMAAGPNATVPPLEREAAPTRDAPPSAAAATGEAPASAAPVPAASGADAGGDSGAKAAARVHRKHPPGAEGAERGRNSASQPVQQPEEPAPAVPDDISVNPYR